MSQPSTHRTFSSVIYLVVGLLVTFIQRTPVYWGAFIVLFFMSLYNIYKKPSLGNILFYIIAYLLLFAYLWFFILH